MIPCDMPGRVVIMEGLTVQGHVAAIKEPILYDIVAREDKFPAGLGEATSTALSALCLPLLRDGNLFGVVVFTKMPFALPFNKEEEKV